MSRKIKVMEEVSLIERRVYAEVPPKVEFALTSHGEKLLEVFDAMEKWGLQYARDMGGKIDKKISFNIYGVFCIVNLIGL